MTTCSFRLLNLQFSFMLRGACVQLRVSGPSSSFAATVNNHAKGNPDGRSSIEISSYVTYTLLYLYSFVTNKHQRRLHIPSLAQGHTKAPTGIKYQVLQVLTVSWNPTLVRSGSRWRFFFSFFLFFGFWVYFFCLTTCQQEAFDLRFLSPLGNFYTQILGKASIRDTEWLLSIDLVGFWP